MMKGKKLALSTLLTCLIIGNVTCAKTYYVINVVKGENGWHENNNWRCINVQNNSSLTIKNEEMETEFNLKADIGKTTQEDVIKTNILVANGGVLKINSSKLNFVSLCEPTDSQAQYNFAGWLNGNGTVDIDANEIYIGSTENGGDRGFQFVGANNHLTINSDKLVAYVGDQLINAQGDESGTSVASFGTADNPIKYFEAHATFDKQNWGVALLQANEGNTVNLYADTAILDGSEHEIGGVIGSGGYGTVNVVTSDLTIDGNICGTYGLRTDPGKTLELNITTDTLKMTGDINVGSMKENYSNFNRDTVVNITVKEKAEITGDVNILGNDTDNQDDDSIVTLAFENEATFTGDINVEGELGVVNLGGNADMTSSTGYYSATNGGTVNFTGGTWAVNTWDGKDGNITIGEAATVNINDSIEVNEAEVNGAVVIDNSKFEKVDNVITASSATLGDNASILITNANTNDLVSLFSENLNLNKAAVAKTTTDNLMQIVTYDEKTGDILITVADAATALPGTIIPAIVTNLTDKNISNAFFDDMLKSGDAAKATAAINSLANMGELAGVNHGTYSMSNTMTDAVAHHLSLATHGEQDKDIWAHYIHNKEDIDGMSLGGVDANYDAQFNGIVIGSDLYKNGKTTAGIALSYADGNINGYNGIARSKNDAEYYGATLYGRIENDNSAVLGDITYMHSDNDVTQTNSGHEITASADADAFSIGVRAEQAIKAGAGKFVPYAGLRYMHLGTGNYTNSLGMEYNADDQNLWLLPVGVTYSAEIASGNWTLKPIAEVGYVWTMGDRETDQTVYLNGAADSFGFETADSGSFISRFGLEAQNGSMTYGLGYEYQKGDSVKANRWLVNMIYSF